MSTSKIYKIKEVADLFKMSEMSIYNFIKTGHLKGYKIGRHWRFTEDNIKNFLNISSSDYEEDATNVLPLKKNILIFDKDKKVFNEISKEKNRQIKAAKISDEFLFSFKIFSQMPYLIIINLTTIKWKEEKIKNVLKVIKKNKNSARIKLIFICNNIGEMKFVLKNGAEDAYIKTLDIKEIKKII